MISIPTPVLLLALALPAAPQDPPAAERVRHGLPGRTPGTESWLVTFAERPFDLRRFREAVHARASADAVARIVADLEVAMRAHQEPFVELVESLGGRVTSQWWLINGCAIEIPFAELDAVRAHPNVLYLHPDEIAEPLVPIKTSTDTSNHGTDVIQGSIRGAGVSTAIVDTGCDANTANGAANRPHATFYVDGDTNNKNGKGLGGSRLLANVKMGAMPPDNSHAHGTGVAGIAAGGKWNASSAADHGHAPHAGIVSYSISNNSAGGSSFQVIANTWQQVAKDRVKWNIVSANNSYSGASDPLNPSQQALDSAALNADIIICVAAGNFRASTRNSQSCANGLAVAATNPTVKTMASFSSVGPLFGDTARFYPDLSANGVNTIMPKNESEATTYRGSGTSMASPQVCGAATLFRSVDTKATHLETKAALLTTTEDISARNSGKNRNNYGVGYLRVDTLMTRFLSSGKLASDKLDAQNTTKTVKLAVQQGKAYAASIAWDRLDVSSKGWSDLNLEARAGATTLAVSATPRNLYEKVVFVAKATGTVDLIVIGKKLEKSSVPFALAAMEVPPPFVPGVIASYGQGCKGTGKSAAVRALPSGLQKAMGRSASLWPFGYRPHRYQQVFDPLQVPAPLAVNGVAFRFDDRALSRTQGWVDLQIDLGYSTNTPATMSATFSRNVAGQTTTIYTRKRLNLPRNGSLNPNPEQWDLKIPADRPFGYAPKAGQTLLFDATQFARSTGSSIAAYYVDADFNSSSPSMTRVYSLSPTAPSGVLTRGFGAVVGIMVPNTGGAVPLLEGTGAPQIGRPFALDVKQARAGTTGALLVGISDTKAGAFNLPFDLTAAGMPGCWMLASSEAFVPLTVDAQGNARVSLNVPNDKWLIQQNLFHQVALVDPPANATGVVTTNGIKIILGGQP